MKTSKALDCSVGSTGRRRFLKAGAALISPVAAGFPSLLFAQGMVTVGFQCSWIKTITPL